jgi:C_GCAxxG_C_C family probable redox protein
MNDPADIAENYFEKNFNCAQSVFAPFAVRSGLDEETALKIATAFGGGISRRGETCGAVSGALMAIGLIFGSAAPEAKQEVYRLGQDFMHRFEDQHGSLLCRTLIGVDISTPEGLQKARASGVTRFVCPKLVHQAAVLLQTMLDSG